MVQSFGGSESTLVRNPPGQRSTTLTQHHRADIEFMRTGAHLSPDRDVGLAADELEGMAI
jgi:hypothetical protein